MPKHEVRRFKASRRRKFAMAKGRRRRPLVTIPHTDVITLSTLANNIVIKESNALDLNEDFFCVSMDITASLRGGTAGEGPIKIGWANDDLSVAEIAEALAAAPLGPASIIERERARRPVRMIGQFTGLSTNEELNDGVTLRVKVRRLFSSGANKALTMWAQNRTGAGLTGGQVVSLDYRLYGFWRV